MEKKVQVKENCEVVITFTSQNEEWKKAQEKEFRKLADKLTVPGFRKGKVPLDMAKKRINTAEVLHEAMFALVNKAYQEAVEEGKYQVFSDPKLDVTKVSEDEVECTVTFALPPKVTLGAYKDIKEDVKAVKVAKKEVEAFIENLRNDHATMMVKDGEAKLQDTVIIDFKGFIDDVPFDGGEAKGYELKLGSNSFVPGFEEQLVGIKANEHRSISVTFPENYVENLASKVARFEVKCSDVKETVLPEINSEFFEEIKIEGVNSVEELEKHAKAKLKEEGEKKAKQERLDAIINKIVDNAEVAIGDTILESEAKASIDQMKKQVEGNGLTFQDYLKINNTTEEALMTTKKEEAQRNIKAMLVIEEICHQEKIQVTQETLNAKFEEIATQYGMKVEDVKKALEPNQQEFVRNLRNQLFTSFIEQNNQ